jgi:GDP-D-mannose dehydratase
MLVKSWERSYETIDTNIVGTLNLLQSVVDLDFDISKFDTAGTSEKYGDVKDEMLEKHEFQDDGRVLLSEWSLINPTSICARSKLAADFLSMNYHDAYGLPTVTTRMFNNYGPETELSVYYWDDNHAGAGTGGRRTEKPHAEARHVLRRRWCQRSSARRTWRVSW